MKLYEIKVENMNYLGQLRPICGDEIELIRTWRNHPTVQSNMYTRHNITAKEHIEWWEKIQQSASDKYLMYELDNAPMGIVGFTNIDMTTFNSSWAFYASPDAAKGIGAKMEFLALDYAFDKLGIHKLSCEVLAFNASVIKLHKKFGFTETDTLHKHHKVNNEFIDIYCLELLSAEWLEHRSVLKKTLDKINRR